MNIDLEDLQARVIVQHTALMYLLEATPQAAAKMRAHRETIESGLLFLSTSDEFLAKLHRAWDDMLPPPPPLSPG